MAKKSKIYFEISERKVLLRILDIILVLGSLQLVSYFLDFDYFKFTEAHWAWIIFLAVYLTIFCTIFELYNLQKTNDYLKVFKNLTVACSITVLFYLLTPFYTPNLPANRFQIVIFYFTLLGTLSIWRFAYIKFISSPRFHKKVIIVGDSFNIADLAQDLQSADPHYLVSGYIDTNQDNANVIDIDIPRIPLEHLKNFIEQEMVVEVVVSISYNNKLNKELYDELIDLLEVGFPIREYTQVYEELNDKIPIDHLREDFYKYFLFSKSNQNKLYLFFHRLTDISCAIIGIVLGSLGIPFVLIGNILANKGPLFYSQIRVGRHGKEFKMLKLRTMVPDAESKGAQWAQANDTRITKFGKFLRNTRLDEVPQFYNVLKGEMSMIGPRPERPVFVKELAKEIPFYEIRHVIKPGLTGWAQVSISYGSSVEDSLHKLQYDLYYIKRRNLFLDLRIVLKTLSTIIFLRGQ
ncbi:MULTISPECIES: exopolysaccharide biosynthesis polyprenyl glycosylphosphotransferase [Mesonia]|uniref:UDP-N-acetylgalactosamine-undecaprenyl-phosphate N-acetylgalactosaminephosphotransferase n=1 Tax=Mesonia oceanica TaxID=2687242 RepID=A0AC61Y9Y7_9FLAO|nr:MULTISPECIES: exopolysaccharide biosynthesis polyprenyl glycosylphosphotransferase [Mesonia]MAN26663.1 sugar transferase [Mesonia sp.]MAQ40060.1 sugar transferase [Mesonia sp.]MBJ96638.1 sugar transferase [Flavobacteriaceae bacterium]VVV01332.1 UDP-N-acetylgalactosamine-undecaprenyl-phosphate N-acetylgalactosaminephosphotransferase [Mesonia oceanica]|tara:strand:- start:14180 stop:15571 length:1392 start_codon:yes stop_codon:yes gene_type:complete